MGLDEYYPSFEQDGKSQEFKYLAGELVDGVFGVRACVAHAVVYYA